MVPVRLSNGSVMRIHDLHGDGPPLVFLHGLGCASSCDYPQVAGDVALRGRHAILVDLLGHGFSDKPPSFQYSVAAHAETVVELFSLLGLSSVRLYGHSMGGSVAIAAAGLAAGRVSELVLSEPNLDAGIGRFSVSIAAQDESTYVQSGHARNVAEVCASGHLAWAGSMSVASALAVHRGAVSLVQGASPSWRVMLDSLVMRRTVLFGEHSLPNDDFVALPRSGIDVRMVKKAGHFMASENPSGLAQAIASSFSA
jgi:pimeloyl-ACP methyl ester carboxylesterase